MSYLVNLDAFYGPLDLLLFLVEKNEMNIYDIPIHIITDQYMEYIQSMGQIDLDQAGDFLIMASYLLNLKSKMLLPQDSDRDEEEEILDPREELVRQLLEYRRYKEAAASLAERMTDTQSRVYMRQAGIVMDSIPAEYSGTVEALVQAFQKLLTEEEDELFQIPRGDINVSEKMEEIMERLERSGHPVIFQDFFHEVISKREALAMFLALLELIRMKKITAVQREHFAAIEIFIKVGKNNADER